MPKSLRDYLPESFLVELGEGPSDSNSPVSGATADGHPNPAKSEFGKRELKVGDPVKVTGDVQSQGQKGVVDNIEDDGNLIVVDLKHQGKKSFKRTDIDFDEYEGKDDEEDSYRRALNNYKKMAGY